MIDVIIPTYNSRDSIVRCLSSICFQTIKDLVNVYIIDDFSTDDYEEIILFFSDKLNVKLFKLEKNSGPGVARQFGLDNSNGKYICFLDSDDFFINCFALENMYKVLSGREDVIVYGYTVIEEGNGYYRRLNNEGSLHGKMFCRKIIDEYNLRFYPGYNHEDLSFYLLYLASNVEKIYIDDSVYCYTHNEGSITNKDSDYELQKSGKYVDNIIWYVENCEKRHFNKFEIASNIYYALVILYNIYNKNYDNENVEVLIKDSKKLYVLFEKYNNYLNDDLKIELFNSTGRDFIPYLSFYDFMKRVSCVNVIED